MPLPTFSLLATVATLAFALPASAQIAAFEPSDYGKANLSVRQNTGDAAAFIAASEGGAFEPLIELSESDRMAVLSRPVGRIDVLLRDPATGEEGASTCTGALLGGGLVLTNEHCLPQGGPYEIVEASILMGYLSLDGSGSERFAMDPVPLETRADLDFAVARVDPAAETRWGHVALGSVPPGEGATRVVFHHPLGRPKVMSRFRCLVLGDRAGPPIVAHRCDTLPGSSGSLLVDDRGVAVALHRAGGLDASDPTSFNMAIDMGTILQASAVLSGTPAAQSGATGGEAAPAPATAAETAPVTETEPGRLSTGQMNDILKGN